MQGKCNRVVKREGHFIQYVGDNVIEVCDFIKKYYPRMVDDYDVGDEGTLFILDEGSNTTMSIDMGHFVVAEQVGSDGHCALDTMSECVFLSNYSDIEIQPWEVKHD